MWVAGKREWWWQTHSFKGAQQDCHGMGVQSSAPNTSGHYQHFLCEKAPISPKDTSWVRSAHVTLKGTRSWVLGVGRGGAQQVTGTEMLGRIQKTGAEAQALPLRGISHFTSLALTPYLWSLQIGLDRCFSVSMLCIHMDHEMIWMTFELAFFCNETNRIQ